MTSAMTPSSELLAEYGRARAHTDDLRRDLTPGQVVWRPARGVQRDRLAPAGSCTWSR